MSPDRDPDADADAGLDPLAAPAPDTLRIEGREYAPDALERLAWQLLAAGARAGAAALHLGTLCSIGTDGYPIARTMALREVDPAGRRVSTHADPRSPKVDGLAADPRSTWLFFDPQRQLQVVLKGDTALHAAPAVTAPTATAPARFGVLVTRVVEMEVLHLDPDPGPDGGHRLVRFRYDDPGPDPAP